MINIADDMMNVVKFHISKPNLIEPLLPVDPPVVIVTLPPSALTAIDTDMMKIIADMTIIDMNAFFLENI